jgi:anti-anti-sigma factor
MLETTERPCSVCKTQQFVIALKGDITSEAGDRIRQGYARACAGSFKAVIFDFDKVRYINSEGIAVFFSLVRDMTDGLPKMVFASLTPNLQSIIKVVGLGDYVHLADSVDAWVAGRTKPGDCEQRVCLCPGEVGT